MGKNDLLTVMQAAALLDVHQQTIRDAINRGKLPCERVLGRIGVRVAAVEAYRLRTRPDGEKPKGRPPMPPPPVRERGGGEGEADNATG